MPKANLKFLLPINALFPHNKAIITQCGDSSVITNTQGDVIGYEFPLKFDGISALKCDVIDTADGVDLIFTNKGSTIFINENDHIHAIYNGDKFHYTLYISF